MITTLHVDQVNYLRSSSPLISLGLCSKVTNWHHTTSYIDDSSIPLCTLISSKDLSGDFSAALLKWIISHPNRGTVQGFMPRYSTFHGKYILSKQEIILRPVIIPQISCAIHLF